MLLNVKHNIDMKHLTNKEEELMNVIWEKGPQFVRDLLEQLPEPKPHYNTVSTVVRGLVEKGFLKTKQYGTTHQYSAVVTKDEYSKDTIKDVISKYFNKSYASVVSMFVEEQDISKEEIQDLLKQVEKGKKKE